jgi:hypothetical protein
MNKSSRHTNSSSNLRRFNSAIQSPVWSGLVWSGLVCYRLSSYRLRVDCIENTACIVEDCLPLGYLTIDVLYRLRVDCIENTACIVEDCLPLGYLTIDVLLLSAIVCCWGCV